MQLHQLNYYNLANVIATSWHCKPVVPALTD